MSIKPEFANLIFEDEKGYEFRKVLFKNPDIKTIVVYASSPVQKVIGEFEIEEIISMEPSKLWNKTKDRAGISKSFFLQYFEERLIGHAIKVGKKKLYRTPKCLKKDFDVLPPQSFIYLH